MNSVWTAGGSKKTCIWEAELEAFVLIREGHPAQRDWRGVQHGWVCSKKGREGGMVGEQGDRSVNGQSDHNRNSLAEEFVLFCRHWGATAGFHTEERLGQFFSSFIVKIDLSGNRVDIEEE